MKNLLFIILAFAGLLMQAQVVKTFTYEFDSVMRNVNYENAATGIIYDRVVPFANLTNYNSNEREPDTANADVFVQAYSELYRAAYVNDVRFPLSVEGGFSGYPDSVNHKKNYRKLGFSFPVLGISYSAPVTNILHMQTDLRLYYPLLIDDKMIKILVLDATLELSEALLYQCNFRNKLYCHVGPEINFGLLHKHGQDWKVGANALLGIGYAEKGASLKFDLHPGYSIYCMEGEHERTFMFSFVFSVKMHLRTNEK